MSLSLIIPCLLIFVILILFPLFVSRDAEKKSENSSEWDKIKKYGDEINDKTRSNKKK